MSGDEWARVIGALMALILVAPALRNPGNKLAMAAMWLGIIVALMAGWTWLHGSP